MSSEDSSHSDRHSGLGRTVTSSMSCISWSFFGVLTYGLRLAPRYLRWKRPVGHSWRLDQTSIPKASTLRGVTPNLYVFRSRGERIQRCAILSSKLRNPYGVCVSGIYRRYHQLKGARSNGVMKRVILADIRVNLNLYIGPIKLVLINY